MATSVTACFARVAKTLSPEDREQVLAPLRREILAQLDAQRSEGADARALAVGIIDRMLAADRAAPSPAEGSSQNGAKPKNLREAINERKRNAENAAPAPVAESLAPGRSADGDAGVATSQGGGSAATHADPGKPAEPATQAVVAQTIAKADLPNPWQISQDEFVRRVTFAKEGSTQFPWVAKWGDRILEAQNEEFDHPDLGKTIVNGGRFSKTKREAEVVARGAHKRAVRRAALNGETPTAETLAAYPDLKPQEPAKPVEAPKNGEVADAFGETLPPARRNMAAKLDESLTDEDIVKRPFSEIWPLAENDAIEDTFAAAVAHAARAEVPAKPRTPYKLKRWVESVKTVRELASMIVSGRTSKEQLADMILGPRATKRALRDWWSKVLLLEQVSRDQWNRIEAVEERPDAVTYEDGKQVPAPMVRTRIDERSHWLTGDSGVEGDARGTVAGNMAGIQALLASAEPEQRMQFEIRQPRNGGKAFINKKGDPEYRHLMEFDTPELARKAITEQYDALVAAWEQVKARDNITERDLRSAENRPRAGKDHRQGKDVTPEEFQDTFGFRGGEFGKWVQQGKGDKERQALLNSAYDALMDLADIVGVPPRALSLNGTLGIAFGSRGSGWASAHYEPSNLVINLTKTRGAGALAHEWFHALDNYFSRMRRGGQEAPFTGDQGKYRAENYITHGPEPLMVRKDRARGFSQMTVAQLKAKDEVRKSRGRTGWPEYDAYELDKWERDPSTPEGVRPEVEARFAALVRALNESPMTQRAALLDKGKSGGYWSQTLERAARAFESYVIAKMHEEGYHNDFLVNVRKSEETGKDVARYPYLLAGEVKPIAEAFDALFGEMQTRDEGDKTVLFSREPAVDEATALRALSQNDALFALPKSSATTVDGITADNAPVIKVRETVVNSQETMYRLTAPDGTFAFITERKPNPFGPSVYGYEADNETPITTRPGENLEAVPDGSSDVWVDVSRLKPGKWGAVIYNIAATYAHNTGRIFIGDPAGVSPEAIRRRPEHMLSSALKFGTTRHLAPHPEQVARGLRWVYGDDLGNIRRLVDLNLRALDNEFPAARNLTFDVSTGQFTNRTTGVSGSAVSQELLRGLADGSGGGAGADLASGGGKTLARGAVLNALLRGPGGAGATGGQRDGLLARLAGLADDQRAALAGAFYSRADGDVQGLSPAEAAAVGALPADKRAKLESAVNLMRARRIVQSIAPNASIRVVQSVADMPPKQRDEVFAKAPSGRIRGAYFRNDDQIWLVSDNLRTEADVVFVTLHEAFHRGLTNTFGPQAALIMRRMHATNANLRELTQQKMQRLGIGQDEAIEEALADLAGKGEVRDLKGWDRLVKLIRNWLSGMAQRLGFPEMVWSDAMIEEFVAGVRKKGLTADGPRIVEQDSARLKTDGEQQTDRTDADIRLSATEQPRDDLGRFSRAVPEWVTSGSEALRGAASKIDTYAPTKPIGDKLREMSTGWKDKLVQGMLDAYAPLKRLSMDAYIAARMTKAADGAFEGMLMYGKPLMSEDGGITGDLDGKGFLGVMRDLNGEHDRFFMWLAGNRAERLRAEGKENLFTDDEIAAMKALNGGRMADGRYRAAAYAQAHQQFNSYSKAVLDVAERSGLIDGESRSLWEHDFYVPFYRMSQEQDHEIRGPGMIKGLARQKAFERLKGGRENLGDLMDNTLRNWSHLLSASLANVAASKSLLAAADVGVALEAKESTAREMAKSAGIKGNATYFMDHGVQRWFVVEDPAVLQAVSALEAPALNGLPLQLMGKFKKYLTVGVTISPAFKLRNLVRDTLAAPAANEMSYNVAQNLAQGWKATNTKTEDYAQMLFSGGLMRFGTHLEGDRAAHVKRLIAQGVDDKTILNTPQKVKAALGKAWDAWQEFGDRLENVNRTALYKQLLDKGLSPRDAAFQARDMMDFSLQGSWAAMRTLTAVVPFLNARAQGLYKLGRAAKEDPRRMGYMVAAVSLASIALMLAYGDDDDWKEREDWDRDGFWWFKIGDTAFRIPKPFELGAMGTIAERSVELLISDEMTGKRFAERMKQMLLDTFAMNPVPQAFKPMLDLYANKDSFTGRQIETLGMERLSKGERYGPNTSALARMLGAAGEYTGVSPVQVDHLIRAYFGWLGMQAVAAVDLAASPFDSVARPTHKLDDYFAGFVKELPAAQSRYTEEFYKQAKVTAEAMADLRRAREVGDLEKAAEIIAERGDDLRAYRTYQKAQAQMSEINRGIRIARGSAQLDSEAKRERLDMLEGARNRLAKLVSDRTRSLEATR